MSPGERGIAAARAALGAPFRLHGRDPATGLDCIGVVALALRAEGFVGEVPSGYRLRSDDVAEVVASLEAAGLEAAVDPQPGDVLLLRAGPAQLHFGVQSKAGIIHADAMLRRVVERPEMPWPVIGRWRVTRGD